jgi:hypothetical protein
LLILAIIGHYGIYNGACEQNENNGSGYPDVEKHVLSMFVFAATMPPQDQPGHGFVNHSTGPNNRQRFSGAANYANAKY